MVFLLVKYNKPLSYFRSVFLCREWYTVRQVTQIFEKSKSRLKILNAIRVTRSMLHTANLKILGPTVKNVVARATWRPGLVH